MDAAYAAVARDVQDLIDPATVETTAVERLAVHACVLENVAAILASEALNAGPHAAKALAGGAARAAEGAARLMALRLQVLDWQRRSTQRNIPASVGDGNGFGNYQAPRLPQVLAGLPFDEMNSLGGAEKNIDA
ncbi:hypothetical protein [Cupriavidus metallidurans]|uniref:hypothetical protein n=1 Tax=Cupriavidus metallidurans TaxID=119219 RepID=UPI001644AA19|nr:hypothetical protein [Cupriavidus metallidurans]